MIFTPFEQQKAFLLSPHRILAGFAGKRGGKTEVGAIRSIMYTENQRGFKPNGVDPYAGAIIAPTFTMLRRLSMKKFMAYAKPFNPQFNKTEQCVTWPNGSIIYGLSADNPSRMEGLKLNWVWMDEVWQMDEQAFLEAIARVADTTGDIWVTGSLGVQYQNPKAHWAYKKFKENPIEGSHVIEWATSENPHFPIDELDRLKGTLDPRTYRQMFTVDYNVPGTAMVYGDLDESNIIRGYQYNPNLETAVCIDWGFAHDMACLFFQYDRMHERVYLFDEIVKPKLTIDKLWEEINAKGYRINQWYCDIAGNQEREQTGKSNVEHYRKKYGVFFKFRPSHIQVGIALVRSWIKNELGQRRLFIDEVKCPKSLDGLRNYSYPQKNGIILNENPVKKQDDTCDSLRYYFVNRHDVGAQVPEFTEMNRWAQFGR